jgi:hypothetical protein
MCNVVISRVNYTCLLLRPVIGVLLCTFSIATTLTARIIQKQQEIISTRAGRQVVIYLSSFYYS